MIKLLVEYEDTSATERYFLKLLVVGKYTFCERMVLWQEYIRWQKLQFCGLFLAKLVNFGLEPHVSDAKTDPYISIGANLFVYLNHIGIQIS